jgi:hypothetical protein
MYGSYPEITITARYLRPLIRRFRFFNLEAKHLLLRRSADEIVTIARDIHDRNDRRRRELGHAASH